MTGPEEAPPEGGPDARSERAWPRAMALLAAVIVLDAFRPSVLIGLPLVLLVVVLPTRRLPAVVAAALAVWLVLGGAFREGLWYVERGWAMLVGGWFAALTLRWPSARFTPRALGAVAGALAVTALIVLVRPGAWGLVDWLLTDAIRAQFSEALRIFRELDPEWPSTMETGIWEFAEAKARLFPAVLSLASLAGLGVAWWLWTTLARGVDGGLGRARDFDFDDRLVWVLLVGLGLVALGACGWSRAGWNAVLFMGGLYALRGVAVALFMAGGVSFLWGTVFVVAALFVWPVVMVSVAVIGLGETWLKVRERAREMVAR